MREVRGENGHQSKREELKIEIETEKRKTKIAMHISGNHFAQCDTS